MKTTINTFRLVKIALIILMISGISIINSLAQCTELIWADEFNGPAVDSLKWSLHVDDKGGGNAELQYYTDREENIKIVDSVLVITARKEQYLTREYTSAKLDSKNKGDWKFGRYEARIKLPEGQGMWPAFWMMPAESKYGPWPNSGEIDIMEMVGHEPSTVLGTLHHGPPQQYTNGSYNLPTGKFSDDFHVFALEWGPDSIIWEVDDSVYSMKNADSVANWNVFQERFYLILNLAVGGNWPGSPDETTVFPQTMEVDYVRVYGDPAAQRINPIGKELPNASGFEYSYSDIPGATFNWTVPDDASIIEGQGTHSIKVDLGCIEDTVSLEVIGTCGTYMIKHPVEFSSPFIAGDTLVYVQSDSLLFTVADLINTTYEWTIPDDVTILSGLGNDSLYVNWGCSEDQVSVTIVNDCFSLDTSLMVQIETPVLTGAESVLENATGKNYFLTELPGENTYTWQVPEDAVISSGQSTNSITVDFGLVEGNVTVEVTNTCGTNSYGLPVSIGNTIVYCTFEGSNLEFLPFASTDFEKISNPFKSIINPSEYVGKTFKSTTTWAGIYADLGDWIDFSKNNTFKLKVYGPKTGQVLFKIEEAENQPVFMEIPAELTKVEEWEELSFDFTDAESGTYNRITLFFDFGSSDTNHYYFDDIKLVYTEPVSNNSVGESPFSVSIFPNPAKEKLYVNFHGVLNGAVTFELYNGSGILVKSVDAVIRGGNQTCTLETGDLPGGVYFIKVHNRDGYQVEKFLIH
ncbi:MAG: family 16 glycosylhydrolase [Bacteroidales bacterium]|nr:family 16 glycosylhydrolase [Bacteroidales bacterium]